MTKDAAVSELEAQKLDVTVLENYNSDVAKGKVISQNPASGTGLLKGDSVTIYVSKGNPPVTVSFNANGGSVSTSSATVYYTASYGSLPTPSRNYYTFDGWYTAADGGTKITSSSIVENSSNHTLYAHWKQKGLSDWVLASEAPSDAEIVNTKWTYTKTETTTSKSSFLSGWTQTGSTWEKTDSGTHYYGSFPSGFNTNDYRYTKYDGNAISSSENTTSKRSVSNSSVYTYVYYHWAYDNPNLSTEDNCFVTDTYNTDVGNGYKGTIWECFESTTNATEYNTGCYKFTGHSSHSYWWFKITVYKQTYTDYQKVYNYKKVTSCTSETEVSNGGEISNVKKYVQYREK